jgi:hypothetical protein
MSDEVFILFPGEVDRILRVLYHGSRPPGVKYLVCGCGRHANLTVDDAEAIGWQILPYARCPSCLMGLPYEGPQARERYLALVEQLVAGKVG